MSRLKTAAQSILFLVAQVALAACIVWMVVGEQKRFAERRAASEARPDPIQEQNAENHAASARRFNDLMTLNRDALILFRALVVSDAHHVYPQNFEERQFIYMEYRSVLEAFDQEVLSLNAYLNSINDLKKHQSESDEEIQRTLSMYEAFFSETSVRFQDLADQMAPILSEDSKKLYRAYSIKRAIDAAKYLQDLRVSPDVEPKP